ncbi:hypothetical protein C8241_13510 [Paracidovorax avenae]|uniref:hypothetical protein n=1 Tax=Paracidovorax avenae TaxID=80867 RepID=UPI000D1630B4|nr:hypothetical protein [Paracidovorax avenae]AVS62574.1 hypothetical protein C8241_13510 [Paracidovorax avenae]
MHHQITPGAVVLTADQIELTVRALEGNVAALEASDGSWYGYRHVSSLTLAPQAGDIECLPPAIQTAPVPGLAAAAGAGQGEGIPSGFVVPYPTNQEGFDHCAYRASVLELAALLAQSQEFMHHVFLAGRIAAADCLSELTGDPYHSVRMHLERNPALVKLGGELVGRSLGGSSSSDFAEVIDWLVHGVSVGERSGEV